MPAMNKLLVITLVLVSACGKSPCKQAVQHMLDLSITEEGKRKDKEMGEELKLVGEALTGACEKDKWPNDAIECLTTASDVKVARKCEDKLTPAQQQASEQAVERAVKEHMSAGKGTSKEAGGDGQISGDDTIKQITDQRDRLCACKDPACAEAIDKEWNKLKLSSERARHDDSIKEQFNKIDDERFKCYLALTGKK